ncbi:hypothetical protein APHAL10511_003652 [Amanita phalloides]|nr:hypothetical protein APHAL10511_003652 [Amanita phalloides]
MSLNIKDPSERSSTVQNVSTKGDCPPDDPLNWSGHHISEYYSRNQLHNYSFGTAPRLSNSPSTHPVTAQDDELEELMLRADITPRPSVVAYDYRSSPRTPGWHYASHGTSAGEGIRMHASLHGRGRDHGKTNPDSTPSSASVSVTSLNESLYTSSAISVVSSSTPQTPSNDFTSSEDDDERRNPYYVSGPYPNPSATASSTSMEFSSEEEYESDGAADIEISSLRAASIDMSFQEEYPSDEAPYPDAYYLQERRGSLPMAIPGVSTTSGINGQYPFNRNREDDLIYARRPSRSLDDDLQFAEMVRGSGGAYKARPDESTFSSPFSVPGSDSDWRNLNARVRQRGNDTGGIPEVSQIPPASNQAHLTSADSMGDFGLDWDNIKQGIVSFDQSELADIIRHPGTDQGRTSGGPRWFPRFVGGTNQDARRQSVTTVTSLASDTFGRAVFRWGGEGYQEQRKDWTFKREKSGNVMQQYPGASSSGQMSSRTFASFLGSKVSEDDKKKILKEREKEKERISRASTSWKGMLIDSHEIWKMDLIGTFRIERRATRTADLSKGPQQRIIVHHLRGADDGLPSVINGPMSTIHKHSKAVAFSIGRFYRRKNESKEKARELASGPLITASHPPAPTPDSQKRSGGMILLAPRRVQVAFTNTTSTRKLESHGLLDEDRSGRVMREYDLRHERERDRERKEREKAKKKEKEKQKAKEKEKQKQSKMQDHRALAANMTKTRSDDAVNLTGASRFINVSSGSDSRRTLSLTTSTTTVAPSISPSMELNTQHSDFVESDTSSRSLTPMTTNLQVSNRPRRRRRRIHDPLEMDEEEDEYENDDNGRHSPPTRTPHSETYGTVDASLIEQLNLERAQHEMETGSVFKRFFRGRSNRSVPGSATGQLEANYDPPWIVLPSRSRQEQQQRVVENLNSSFMDVGLLPSNHRMKKYFDHRTRDDHSNGILSEVPEESLYMLLPLWPGDTDPISIQAHLHLVKRIPPADNRRYILIYYRSMKSRKKDHKKKHSSSIADDVRTDRCILLTSFHISARFVEHNELIGTGIRVPDEGLTVSGPLDYAWESLPSTEAREECTSDWIIGVCHSRESGVEFLPEGLVKMDLCRMPWKPPSAVNDNYTPPEPTCHLTPIGRSVVEMAWLGAMALMSFGQVGQP